MDRRQELTEMAYEVSEMLNKGRVEEGKQPLPKEEVDEIVRKFVEAKLASEAAAPQNKTD